MSEKKILPIEEVKSIFLSPERTLFREKESEQKYGGPHHFAVYRWTGKKEMEDMSESLPNGAQMEWLTNIDFQEGPAKEVGINGIDERTLLVILIKRLESFQKGPLCCRENGIIITKLEEALLWTIKRTLDRKARGVEGTYKT